VQKFKLARTADMAFRDESTNDEDPGGAGAADSPELAEPWNQHEIVGDSSHHFRPAGLFLSDREDEIYMNTNQGE
jgi:hypothetical protein